MLGHILFVAISVICIGLMVERTSAKIVGSDLSSASQSEITDLKVKAGDIPVGTIVSWPVSQNLDTEEWLECDGSMFDTTKYSELYTVLRTNRLSDYRTQFLRGGTASQAGTIVDESIKSHSVNLPIADNGAVYVPGLSSASDTITSVTTNTVKTGTEQYVCGSEQESYTCGCRTESYECGTEETCSGNSILICRCREGDSSTYYSHYISCREARTTPSNQYCNDVDLYRTAGVVTLMCGRFETDTYKCAFPSTKVVDCSYDGGRTCNCTKKTKYCSRTVGCTTCYRTVDKYCTRDVYSTQVVTNKDTAALTLEKLDVKSASNSGVMQGEYVGGVETAPKHVYVRYYIKAQ